MYYPEERYYIKDFDTILDCINHLIEIANNKIKDYWYVHLYEMVQARKMFNDISYYNEIKHEHDKEDIDLLIEKAQLDKIVEELFKHVTITF